MKVLQRLTVNRMPNETRLEGAVMFATNVADTRCKSALKGFYTSRMATSESISTDARTAVVKLPQLVPLFRGGCLRHHKGCKMSLVVR